MKDIYLMTNGILGGLFEKVDAGLPEWFKFKTGWLNGYIVPKLAKQPYEFYYIHQAVYDNVHDRFLFFGGINGPNNSQTGVIYNYKANEWYYLNNIPTRSYGYGTVTQGKGCLLVPGQRPSSSGKQQDCYYYDYTSGVITNKPNMPYGVRGSAILGEWNGRVYVGDNNFYSGDNSSLQIYDSSTGTWTTGAPQETYWSVSTGACSNGFFCLFGGSSSYGSGYIYKYNIGTNTWTKVSKNISYDESSATVFKGLIYTAYSSVGSNGNGNLRSYNPIDDSTYDVEGSPAIASSRTPIASDGRNWIYLFTRSGYDNYAYKQE